MPKQHVFVGDTEIPKEPEDRVASDMLESDKAGGTCRCCAEPGGVWSLGPKMKQAGAFGWMDGWISRQTMLGGGNSNIFCFHPDP